MTKIETTPQSSEELELLGRRAEDEGKDVYYARHEFYDAIEYVEIDGVETYNPSYKDELQDQYWLEDSYRIAERYMG